MIQTSKEKFMAAPSYSTKHKARAAQTFLSRGQRSFREVSRELGISHSSLFEWVAAISLDADQEPKPISPESWQAPRRIQAIVVYDSMAVEE
jgi:transposase-like protein